MLFFIFAASGCDKYFKEEKEDIHIALVGPMTGENQSVGRSFKQGVDLCVDSLNRKGGLNGRRLVIDIYDDRNKPYLAREEAYKIVKNSDALAVIGHHYSNCSISAGEVYKEHGVPAITPASTNVKVTENNPWFFRSSFNDRLQGRFLANYANKVFRASTVSIIFENDDYGRYLTEVFEKTTAEEGGTVKYRWRFDPEDRMLDDTLKRIVYDLKAKDDAGVVFISTHAGPGVKLLKAMKDTLVLNPVMGPDAFASEAFRKAFEQFPKEKYTPGFYTNGMYVTTPLIFDTTNEKGQQFKEIYERKFGETPGWHAAFAYDSALVLIRAIEKLDLGGTEATLGEDRRKIRNYLASMNTIENAVEGVTGFNYFDGKGDSLKPVLIGVYKNNKIVSALTQFQTVTNPAELAYLETTLKKDRVMRFDGHYMYRINVVYTGVEFNEISDLNFKDLTCMLDFNLWFRYQGDTKLNEVVFLNAAEPIELGEPIQKRVTRDKLNYYLYNVKGRFKMDFIINRYVYGEHIAGVSFRHPDLARNNLIYVKDVLGMGRTQDDEHLIEAMQEKQVLSPASKWKLKQAWFFQDSIEENSLGNPEFMNITGGVVNYSRFNYGVRIMPDKLVIRNMIPPKRVEQMLIFSIVFIVLLPLMSRTRTFKPYFRILWVMQLIFIVLLLISSEFFLINRLGGTYYLPPIVLFYNLLWWVIPTILITMGIKFFIWRPLEEKTGRAVPQIIQNSVALFLYLIAFFGIVAFVFDQRLTSLLATSGVIAMIIGLAIQINISNIFSGIAINLERPFRVGDWIKIDKFKEGKVIDVNWRTTRIRTRDDTIVSIPNSQASESPIENFSYPDEGYFLYFTVHVDQSHPPDRVKKILLDAAMSTPGVEKEPPPSTRFLGLTAGITGQSESWAANYLISVYFNDYGSKFAHNEAIWDNVWTHLRRAGIKHLMQRQDMNMTIEGIRKQKVITSRPLAVLNELEIFRPFSAEARAYLSQKMRHHHFYPGQQIVNQGDSGNSLFIIEEGVVSVRVRFEGQNQAVEVARTGAGNIFGEMALLTGEPRTASIISLTETRLYEITKDDIAPLLEEEPRISEVLSTILTERKLLTESKKHSGDAQVLDKETLASQLLGKIQNFFGFKRD